MQPGSLLDFFEQLFWNNTKYRCGYRAGTHSIDAATFGDEFAGTGLGKSNYSGIRCGVIGLVEVAVNSVDAGGIENFP